MKESGKRVLSLLLVLVMLFSMLPAAAYADDGQVQKVKVFCNPSGATVRIYGDDRTVEIQPDGDEYYRLLPGVYYYTAEADGYFPLTEQSFRVSADTAGDQELIITLTPVETAKPADDAEKGSGPESGPDSKEPAQNIPALESDEKKEEKKDFEEKNDSEKKDENPVKLGLKFENGVEYVLEPVRKDVSLAQLGIVFRNWGGDEETRYHGKLLEVHHAENDVLSASMRSAGGDIYKFDTLVEFTLYCEDWKGKSLDELNALELSLYLTNEDAELGEAQILFNYWEGHPALFFSTDRLADLLLTEANDAEKARLAAEREEAEKLAAEKEKEQEAEELKKEETGDKKADGGDTDNLDQKENKEPEIQVNYIPQEQTLEDVTVRAQIPEGSLNEYAQLTLTPLSDDLTNTVRALILNDVNPEEEQDASSEAAGDDGQASAAKKQEIASIVLLDVGFVAGDTNHYPTKPVILTIQSDEIKSMSAPRLYHYANGEVEDLTGEETTKIDTEAGTVTFNAASFSPFAVVDLEDAGTADPAEEEKETDSEKKDAPEEKIVYIPQEQSLNDVTVKAQIPEGALNEYALLTLTELNDDMTEAAKAQILAKVNAGFEAEEEPVKEEAESASEETTEESDKSAAESQENLENPDADNETASEPVIDQQTDQDEEKQAEKEEDKAEAGSDDGQSSAVKKQQFASLVLLDISFVAGDTYHHPSAPVILTIKADIIKGMKNPCLYHVTGGDAEDLTEEAEFDVEAGTVTFTSADFSPYAVADFEDEGTVHLKPRNAKNLLGANGEGGLRETLPSGNRNNLHWYVERNESGDCVLVVEPAEGQSNVPIPGNFFTNIKSGLGDYANQLKELQVKDGVTAINGDNAFAGTTSTSTPFEKITLAASVTSVGTNAFRYNANLTTVEMPGVTSIGTRAFGNCTKLANTSFLPTTLTTIGSNAFENCTGMTSADLSGCTALTTIGSNAFTGCTGLTSVNVSGCTALTTIGTYAFSGCTKLKNADLSGCTALTSLGTYAFNNCSALTGVDLSDCTALTTIGERAFQSCSALTTLGMSDCDALTTIGNYAFNNCQKLQSIQLPNSLTSLGNYVFQNCTALQELNLENTSLTTLPSYMISGANQIKSITAPDTLSSISSNALYSAGGLKTVDLSNATGLTTLPSSAFSNCKVLEDVILPESMTNLGTSAFSGCPAAVNLTVYGANMKTPASGLPSGLKNVIVEDTVDVLDGSLINKAVGNDGKITFAGPNDLSVTKASGNIVAYGTDGSGSTVYSTGESANKPLTQLDGSYYVDQNGVLYKLNDDGTAELIYVPAGITSLTVPETITSEAGETYTVTKVGGYAFAEADDLTAVTFDKPSQVSIPPKTFTDSNVATVNGKDKITSSDFAEVSQLCDFPLAENQGTIVPEIDISVTGDQGQQVNLISFEVYGPKPDGNNIYQMKTGDSLPLTITVSNKDNNIMKDAVIRVYIQTTGDGYNLGSYSDPNYDGYSVTDHGKSWPLKVKEGDTPGLYYYEISEVHPGDVFTFNAPFSYPAKSSDGGEMLIWADFLTADEADKTPDTIPIGKYIKGVWSTEQESFKQTKGRSTAPKLVISTANDDRVYVTNMSYSLTVNRVSSTAQPATAGADYAIYMDYDDVLTPTEGIMLTPEVKEAIQAGRVRYAYGNNNGTVAGKTHYYQLTFYAKLADGTEKQIAAVYGGGSPYQLRDGEAEPQLEVVEKDGLDCLHLHFRAASPYLTHNYNGHCYAEYQYPTTTFYVSYEPRVYEMDQEEMWPGTQNPKSLFNQDGSLKTQVGLFHNEVHNTQHYSWGPDQEKDARVDSLSIPNDGKLELTKSTTDPTSSYMGGPITYTVTLKNNTIVTNRTMSGGYLKDTLSTDVYMRPSDIESLFSSSTGNSTLRSVEITKAVFCTEKKTGTLIEETVTTNTGGEAVVLAPGSSGSVTHYQSLYTGISGAQASTDNKILITKENEQYSILVNGEERGPVGVGGLETALNALGFVITRNTTYSLILDLGEVALPSTKSITYKIPAHLKDTFMMLLGDKRYYYDYSSSGHWGASNTVNAYKANDQFWTSASISSTRYINDEYRLRKSASVSGSTLTEAHENDVVTYTLNMTNNGSDTWPVPLPLTDRVSGAQLVLVPVSDVGNGAKFTAEGTVTAVSFSEAGLKTHTTGGVEYYMLNKAGVYTGVKLGGQISDSITVTKTSSGLNTLIKWYFANEGTLARPNVTSKSLEYKAMFSAVETGINTGDSSTGEPRYPINNETWLNDHESHRLYDTVDGKVVFYSFSKSIVEKEKDDFTKLKEPESLVRFSNIHQGEEILYKIRIKNHGTLPGVLRGSDIYDALPKTGGAFNWTADMVSSIQYRFEPEGSGSCPTSGRDYWQVDSILNTPDVHNKDTSGEGQYYIHWKDDFRINLDPDAVVNIYITLKFPTEDDWNQYVAKIHGVSVFNTFYLNYQQSQVEHNLAAKTEAVLRKGVYATTFAYNEYAQNNSYYYDNDYTRWSYADRKDRHTYANGPSSSYARYAQNSVVHYYTVLYNSGNSRLYLEDMEDHLPKGFTFRGLPSYGQYSDYRVKTSTYSNMYRGTEYSSYDFAYVKDNERTVRYANANVSATTKMVDGRQTVTFHFTSANSNSLKYDSTEGKYYLEPGQALRFAYSCYVGPYNQTDINATNTIAMPYYDYLHAGLEDDQKKVDAMTQKVKVMAVNNVANNDGDCEVVGKEKAAALGYSKDGRDQWLVSDVSLTQAPLIPGIQKTVGGTSAPPPASQITSTTILGSTGGDTVGSKYEGYAVPQDIINWSIKLLNEDPRTSEKAGLDSNGSALYKYTVTDTVQNDYGFCGEVFLNLNGRTYTLFRLGGSRSINDTSVPIQIVSSSPGGWSASPSVWLEGGIKINDDNWVIGGGGNYVYYKVKLQRDENTGYETIIIQLLNPTYTIRPGQIAELGLHTQYGSGNYELSRSYLNHSEIHTDIPYNPDYVAQGRPLMDSSGNYLEGDESGVESNATINVINGFAATSVKKVTELGSTSNTASSEDESKNRITLPEKETGFRYDLEVTTPDSAGAPPIRKLVICDNLPEPGDKAPNDARVPRDSAFKVSLMDDPNFVLSAVRGSMGSITFERGDYQLQLSTKTTFDDDDWAGAGEGWIDLTDVEAQKDQIRSARSIRVIIEDESEANEDALFPRGSVIRLSFNARMVDPDNKTKPGDTAWNSFGYQYTIKLGGRLVDLIAAPLVVGVKVPETPRLQKRLVDESGATMIATKDTAFEFLIYTGEPITALNKADKMRMKDIADVLIENGRDAFYVPLTVKEGQSSASLKLGDGKCWVFQNGKWAESEKNWIWKHEADYTILETHSEVKTFRLKTLFGKTNNNVAFKQNGRESVSLVAVNEHFVVNYGELKIIKSINKYESSEPVTFVFDIVGTKDGETVYSNVASITFKAPGEQSTLITGIPVGTKVTVTEVYSGARYTSGSGPNYSKQDQLIVSLDSPDSPLTVTFSNTYDGSGKGGHGILNSFEASINPRNPDEYIWGGWEKPDMNNPEGNG